MTGAEVTGAETNGTVAFKAHLAEDPIAGVQQVWATYTASSGSDAGKWQSVYLAQDGTDLSLWQASVPLPTDSAAGDIRFMVQAVNGVGLVALDDNQGVYYRPGPQPEAQAGTQLTIEPVASSGTYGSPATFKVTLKNAQRVGLAGQRVTVGLRELRTTAVTGTDGRASVTLGLLVPPQSYEAYVLFDGTPELLPASAAAKFLVGAMATNLALSSPTSPVDPQHTNIAATLTAGGKPVPMQTVVFVFEPISPANAAGTVVRLAVTDDEGKAALDAGPLQAGSYTVNAYFGQTVTPGGGDAVGQAAVGYSQSSAGPVSVSVKTPTMLTVAAPATATRGRPVSVVATLTGGGQALAGKKVVFAVSRGAAVTEWGTGVTAWDGRATFSVSSPLTPPYNVTAYFGGTFKFPDGSTFSVDDPQYGTSQTSLTITDRTLIVTANDVSRLYGTPNPASFAYAVTDGAGRPSERPHDSADMSDACHSAKPERRVSHQLLRRNASLGGLHNSLRTGEPHDLAVRSSGDALPGPAGSHHPRAGKRGRHKRLQGRERGAAEVPGVRPVRAIGRDAGGRHGLHARNKDQGNRDSVDQRIDKLDSGRLLLPLGCRAPAVDS